MEHITKLWSSLLQDTSEIPPTQQQHGHQLQGINGGRGISLPLFLADSRRHLLGQLGKPDSGLPDGPDPAAI